MYCVCKRKCLDTSYICDLCALRSYSLPVLTCSWTRSTDIQPPLSTALGRYLTALMRPRQWPSRPRHLLDSYIEVPASSLSSSSYDYL